MLYFLLSVGLLVFGYVVYMKVVTNIFVIEPSRPTPVQKSEDGVDFVKLPPRKIFLIQLLNIAGLGPIFGPVLGALYGPSALLWIVFGNIFGGIVHDFFTGMLSIRYNGRNIADVVGHELGNTVKQFMRFFTVLLLLLVGVVFVLGSSKLLGNLTGVSTLIFSGSIFFYFFLATVFPIDKIIGKVYPIFGLSLIIMVIGIIGSFVFSGKEFFPELTFSNLHPEDAPMWPLMFITIACGAISGFHATQSPLMARCIENEKMGKALFAGPMMVEGIIALIWATVGISFYSSTQELQSVLQAGGPAKVVQDISLSLLGHIGGFLAIIGVIVLPITTGDTAFRSLRLLLAEWFEFDQVKPIRRLYIAIPIFIIGFIISMSDFTIIWRYFSWANQSLATIVLWAASAYLLRKGKFHWITTFPAVFMSAVTTTYILNAKIGFNLYIELSAILGLVLSFLLLVVFFLLVKKNETIMKSNSE